MKKWLETAKPDNRGESLRSLQEVSKKRITSVVDHYFTNLWCVGASQGRGAPSIEYRDRQKDKEACVKIFVEKYDTVTDPSGEGQVVRKEMTVQVEQWWNSSDVAASLREENAWGADGTVAENGKNEFLLEGLHHQQKRWSTTSRLRVSSGVLRTPGESESLVFLFVS
jgi:hypothetical protein